ncbi:MAG TPA: HAMP domain-containing sensor histidine kinase [Nitrosomonas sp.]|uniref:sensor histidine kinase n=1 Tax=Nitrosomonas sp. TaxID=42353 RepID=UPI000E8B7CCB|nr:HAMP domain-containing sensor histidine kinase [Nitrosomonas sp.]GJL74628.1 MAG: two-component system sensor kinase [Nitrosomonas sp.]HBV20167.1 histidine kinase [Nitrosomonas sp.]HNP26251.1 HAMP domain-containing sensor histidine kinase [Nitrosomonas sp.]
MTVNADTADFLINTEYPIPSKRQRYPKSFLKLILLGFSLVGAPLIAALIYIAITIDNLAERSHETIYQATEITHGNRVLADEVLAMERSLRQALILNDLSLLEGYIRSHEKFEETAKNFTKLPLHTEHHLLLEKMRLSELIIFREILKIKNTPESIPTLQAQIENFSKLLATVQDFRNLGNMLINHYANEMLETADQVRSNIEIQLLAVIPFVIFLAILFSILITRPIKQIDEAIYNLGQGELLKPINVTGPQNLKQLGKRLDWLRRRLLKLEKQKNQFLRHISHELKTPLTAIREGADLLAEGVTGNLSRKQQLIADILLSSSLQLQKRIEDLLSYSAIQVAETALVKQPVSLSKILDDTLQNQNLSIMSKKLKIIRNHQDIVYECDAEKIQTIVDNLLSNAIKFSPPCSKIEIKINHNKECVQLDVKDSGAGIHESDRDKIFEPFYQGRFIPDAHVMGTGLGLSIAQEFALAHGGRIFLINLAEPGSYFRLILPMQNN